MNRPRIPVPGRIFSIASMAAFLLTITISLSAQTTSTITGEVRDANSGLLVGVRITATALETGVARTTSSGEAGRFVFPALPVGTYELRAEHNGFEPLVPQTVRLTVNETIHVSLVLKVAGLTENVTVDSGESLVNAEPILHGGRPFCPKFVNYSHLSFRFQSHTHWATGGSKNQPTVTTIRSRTRTRGQHRYRW